MADRSRMNREVHVRICGGLEVKFLRSTRLKSKYQTPDFLTYSKDITNNLESQKPVI